MSKRDLGRPSFAEATTVTQPSEWERAVAWAKRHLPDEHHGFAAWAAIREKRSGHEVAAESVLERLQIEGRTTAQYEAEIASQIEHPESVEEVGG